MDHRTCDLSVISQAIDDFVRVCAPAYEGRCTILGDLNLVEVSKIDGYAVLNSVQEGRGAVTTIDGEER